MLIKCHCKLFITCSCHFNTSHVNVNLYGSWKALIFHLYFNTSHVNVNRAWAFFFIQLFQHFNTSHVNVNRTHVTIQYILSTYFNTSHVNVNRHRDQNGRGKDCISIHLMLMLINKHTQHV